MRLHRDYIAEFNGFIEVTTVLAPAVDEAVGKCSFSFSKMNAEIKVQGRRQKRGAKMEELHPQTM